MADSSMVFPLPLPVIISDKAPQGCTLEEQKTQTEALLKQQGMWTQYLQLFGLNKNQVEEQNNQIVGELKTQTEQNKEKIEQDSKDKNKNKNSEKLKDKLAKFWDKIKFWKYFPDLFKNIKEIAKNSYEKVKGWIEGLAEWFWYSLVDPSGSLISTVVALIIPALGNLVTLAVNLLGTVVPQIINMVIAFLPQLFTMIQTLVLKLVQMAPIFIKALVKAIPILIKGLVKVLPVLVKALIKLTISLFKAVVLLIPVLLKGVWDAVKGIWKELVNAWPELKKSLLEGMSSLGKSILKIFDDIFGGDSSETMKKVKQFFQDIYEVLDYLWMELKGFFKDIYDALGGEEGIMKSFEGVKKAISDIWDSISSFIDDMMPYIEMLIPPLMKLKDAVVRVSLILIKGLKWAFDKLMIVIGPVIDIILWLVKTFFKFVIPIFVWFIDIALDLWDGLMDVIEVIGKVIDWLWDWGVKVIKWFKDLWDTVSKALDSVTGFFKDTWDALANAIKDGLKKLLGYFSEWFSDVKDEVPDSTNSNVETSTTSNPQDVADDQSLYSRALKKTTEQITKGKQNIEKFRESLNKSFNFRTLSIPNVGNMINETITSAFKTGADNTGIRQIVDNVKGSATFKAIEELIGKFSTEFDKFLTKLKGYFQSFMDWFVELPGIKQAIALVKTGKDAAKNVIESVGGSGTPSGKLNVQRQTMWGFNYDAKDLEKTKADALKKSPSLNVKDEEKLKQEFYKTLPTNIEGKELLGDYFIRKLRGEDIKSETFFGGGGTDEAVAEELGKNIDTLVGTINSQTKNAADRDKALLEYLQKDTTKNVTNVIFSNPNKVEGFNDLFQKSNTK